MFHYKPHLNLNKFANNTHNIISKAEDSITKMITIKYRIKKGLRCRSSNTSAQDGKYILKTIKECESDSFSATKNAKRNSTVPGNITRIKKPRPDTEYSEYKKEHEIPTPYPLNAQRNGKQTIPHAVKLSKNAANINKNSDAKEEQNTSNAESFTLFARLVRKSKSSFSKNSAFIFLKETEPYIIPKMKNNM